MIFKRFKAWFAIASMLTCAAVSAQEYPTRPLTLIVPFPPGGVTDIVAREVAVGLSAELGKPVIVDNRAGASGSIGAAAGARAAPDGYTLVMGNISTLAINPVTMAKLTYDPIKSFAPVSMVAVQPLIITVHPSVPARSLAELVQLAKTQPGKLNYGTAGSSIHLAVEHFSTVAGISMTHVPYKGSAPAIKDFLGGQIQVLFDPFSSIHPHVVAGTARALALTTLKRSAAAPDMPTVAESGYAGFDVSSWQGIVAPAGTPQPIIDRLNQALVKVLSTPKIKDSFARFSAVPSPGTPDEFASYIKQETVRWQKAAAEAGVKPE